MKRTAAAAPEITAEIPATETRTATTLLHRGNLRMRDGASGASDEGTEERPPIDTSIERMSLGAGLQFDIGGTLVAVDYAFTRMDLLDNVNQFTLQIGM